MMRFRQYYKITFDVCNSRVIVSVACVCIACMDCSHFTVFKYSKSDCKALPFGGFSGILRGHVPRVLEMSPLFYFIIFLSLKYRTLGQKMLIFSRSKILGEQHVRIGQCGLKNISL